MVFPSESTIEDLAAVANIIEEYNVKVVHMTPSLIKMMLANAKFETVIGRIRIFIVAAETFDETLYDRLGRNGAKVFNGYGPTETTIGVSIGQIYFKCIGTGITELKSVDIFGDVEKKLSVRNVEYVMSVLSFKKHIFYFV